jgi:2-keto-myo-inositol isomerase
MTDSTNPRGIGRRAMITQTGAAAAAVAIAGGVHAQVVDTKPVPQAPTPVHGFKFSLNTATIRGQKLPLREEVEIAAKAGYHAIEPWVEEIQHYVSGGGKPADLKKRIADLGLVVPSAIGFADWIDNDDSRRAAGLEQWKRDADLVASIGGVRMAAPPSGAYNVAIELPRVAERYRKLLELSCPLGIVPELEMWGGAKTLSRMSHVAYVLVEAAHPEACGLLDIFHIFKGGSGFGGVRAFNGSSLHVLHVNDYPAGLTRAKATDADRVYPGDGSAPIATLLRDLHGIGYDGFLSLELFNRDYWKQDAQTVARTGREKMQALVEVSCGK